MPCVSPIHGFVDKETGGIVFKRSANAGRAMKVACGQCIGCRIQRRKEWGARIIHEASQYSENSFVTLTYRDKIDCTQEQLENGLHVPDDYSLAKSHHQKFIKRLRKHFPDRRIRYYHCGEYGDENQRPHYHTCLFNLSFDDEDLYSDNHGHPLFTSKTLEHLWRYGFCTIGNLDYESAQYVAGYCLKKINGLLAHDHYHRYDEAGNSYWIEPEYATMSTGTKKGEGIGANWIKTYYKDVYPSEDLPVPGVGITRGIPRYYDELYADIDPSGLASIKELRQAFAASHPENYTPQRLESQYKIYIANQQRNRRNNPI